MSKDEIQTALSTQQDKIRDVQSLLTAISKLDPGGVQGRIADMAEKQLEDVHTALDALA